MKFARLIVNCVCGLKLCVISRLILNYFLGQVIELYKIMWNFMWLEVFCDLTSRRHMDTIDIMFSHFPIWNFQQITLLPWNFLYFQNSAPKFSEIFNILFLKISLESNCKVRHRVMWMSLGCRGILKDYFYTS